VTMTAWFVAWTSATSQPADAAHVVATGRAWEASSSSLAMATLPTASGIETSSRSRPMTASVGALSLPRGTPDAMAVARTR
jgi:hypothetical protein